MFHRGGIILFIHGYGGAELVAFPNAGKFAGQCLEVRLGLLHVTAECVFAGGF